MDVAHASYFYEVADKTEGYQVGDLVAVVGAALSQGKQISAAQTFDELCVNSMVCFKGSVVEVIDGQVCPKGFTDCVAVGPRLLANGIERYPFYWDTRPVAQRTVDVQTNSGLHNGRLNPLSAIGVSADKRRVWLIVVDGRQEGYSQGATLHDVPTFFRLLGASDALNLDGGGSAVMVHRLPSGKAHVLSQPIHGGVPGQERPVANHVLVHLGEP